MPLMHELACLSKLMGHSFCDMKVTADDFFTKTHEDRGINLIMVQDAVRYAKQDFIHQYILKEGKWPPVMFDDDIGLSEVIVQAHKQDIDPQRQSHQSRYGVLRLSHWDQVTLERCEKFERVENFIPYVKDRTVSLLRSDVFRLYFKEEGYPDFRPNWIETRALLAYLLLPYSSTEHLSYLELYADENWEAMSDLLVARLIPKEKEQQVSARCFGCKPTKERARTIVLGHNASRFLNRYSDSEAMTLSELSLTKKLAAFRNMYHAYKDYKQIIIYA